MVDLVQRNRNPLVEALLARGFAPPASAPTLGSAFAQAANRALAIRQYMKEQEREEKRLEEGAEFGQQAIDALTPQTQTTASYDASKDTGFDPNASGDMGGAGVLRPGMQIQQSQTAPDLNRAMLFAAQGAQRGDPTSQYLAKILVDQRVAQMMPPEPITPLQQKQLDISQQNADANTRRADAAARRAGGSSGAGTLAERLATGNYTPEQTAKIIEMDKALRGSGLGVSIAPDGTVTVMQNAGEEIMTGPQIGAQYKEFEDQVNAAADGLILSRNMIQEVQRNQRVLGTPGDVARILNNAEQTVNAAFGDVSPEDQKILSDALNNPEQFYDSLGPLRATAVGNQVYTSNLIRLAFAMARAAGNTGTSLSNKDVDNYMKAIGQSSDPVAFAATVRGLNEDNLSQVKNAYKYKYKGTPRDSAALGLVDAFEADFNSTFGGKAGVGETDINAMRKRLDAATDPAEIQQIIEELQNAGQ